MYQYLEENNFEQQFENDQYYQLPHYDLAEPLFNSSILPYPLRDYRSPPSGAIPMTLPLGGYHLSRDNLWRQPRLFPMIYSHIEEEDNYCPYDLNGTGTKIRVKQEQLDGHGVDGYRSFRYIPPYRVKMNESFLLETFPSTYETQDTFVSEDEDSLDTLKSICKRKRDDFDEFDDLDELEDLEDIPVGFKLPASKSPIMEAMAFCAIKGWGIEISVCEDQIGETPARVVFKVIDFEQYYKYSCVICSKQNPTEDIGSRVKSLRRWFVNFPKKRDRRDNPNFDLEVKPDVAKKVYEMIEKYRCRLSVKKRRRIM